MLNNYYLEISQGYGRKRKTVRVFDWLNEQSSYDSSGISNVFKPFGSNEFAWEDGSTNTQSSTQFTTTGPNDGNPGGGNPGGGNPGGGNPNDGNPGGGNPGGGNPGGGNPGGGNPGGGNPGGGNPNDGNPGGGNPGGGNKPTRRKRKPPKDCGGSTNDGQIE